MFKATPYTPEFEGDLKHLKKRYPSLDEDLAILVKALIPESKTTRTRPRTETAQVGSISCLIPRY